MNFYWGNVFDYFKDRRHAAVFFGTLAVLFGMPVVAIILYQVADNYDVLKYLPPALVGFGVWVVVMVWREIRQMRSRRLNRYQVSPLSRDEIRKARSKLVKQK